MHGRRLGDCFKGLPSMAMRVGLTSRNLLLMWMWMLQSGDLCFAGGHGTQNRNYVLHPRGLLIWPMVGSAVGEVYCFTFEGQGCSRIYGSCIDLKAQAESKMVVLLKYGSHNLVGWFSKPQDRGQLGNGCLLTCIFNALTSLIHAR